MTVLAPPRPRPVLTRPEPACPVHGDALSGGPVVFWCPAGHVVQAADLSRELRYRPEGSQS